MPHPKPLHALTRTCRVPVSALSGDAGSGNGLVAGVAWTGIGAVAEFELEVVGRVGDSPSESGYLLDITVIDAAIRKHAAAAIRDALRAECLSGTATDLPSLLRTVVVGAASDFEPEISRLTYRPSPFRSVSFEAHRGHASAHGSTTNHGDPAMPSSTSIGASHTEAPHRSGAIVLTETFEFAAAHRLHLDTLSEQENRALFGKCNNPNGHGHNYRIEIAVEIDEERAERFSFADLERIASGEIMARFDHKHLNRDCPEFVRLNPSVENIARVSYELLDEPIQGAGGRLRWVRVWETEKTSCRYPA